MSTPTQSYEYCGYKIQINCHRMLDDQLTWTATYRITRASDDALATFGAISGGYLSPEEAAEGAGHAADFWVDKQARI